MRFCCVLTFLLFSFSLSADDLSGFWKGTLSQDPGGCYPHYFIEFQIHFSGNNVSGNVYDYYDTGKYVKMSVTGKYDPFNHRLILVENKVIEFRIPSDCIPCIKTYDLLYSNSGKEETLIGNWKGHVVERAKNCPPGQITLTRAIHSDFPVDIQQSDSLAQIQETLKLTPRTKDIVSTVTVSVPQIKVELYDNAEIDNDTITVLINNKLLLYQQRLTEKALTLYFNAFPNTEYELVMYADNLGLIPPNTALMVVTAGKKKFEVFLSSSESKSAAVKFVYKPPDP